MNVPLLTTVIVAAAAISVAGIYCVMKLRVTALRKELDSLTAIRNDPAYIQNVGASKALDSALAEAQESYLFLRSAEALAEAGSTVDDGLVRSLFSCFPAGTKIVKLTISDRNISIEGVADSLETAITVQKNLQKQKNLSAVFVPSARADSHTDLNGTDAVSFSVRMTLNTAEGGESE